MSLTLSSMFRLALVSGLPAGIVLQLLADLLGLSENAHHISAQNLMDFTARVTAIQQFLCDDRIGTYVRQLLGYYADTVIVGT